MTLDVPRLPFSLDPLIAEAKRRVRRRRVLVVLVLLAGLAAALTAALRSSGGPTGGPLTGRAVTARYSGFRLRYPSTWTRVNWSCFPQLAPTGWIGLLTNAQPAPKCPGPTTDGGFTFPPRQPLGANVVMVFFAQYQPAFPVKPQWNAHIGGQRAVVYRPEYGSNISGVTVTCAAGGPREYRHYLIDTLAVGAMICGPDLAAGNAAVSRILASLRLKR